MSHTSAGPSTGMLTRTGRSGSNRTSPHHRSGTAVLSRNWRARSPTVGVALAAGAGCSWERPGPGRARQHPPRARVMR